MLCINLILTVIAMQSCVALHSADTVSILRPIPMKPTLGRCVFCLWLCVSALLCMWFCICLCVLVGLFVQRPCDCRQRVASCRGTWVCLEATSHPRVTLKCLNLPLLPLHSTYSISRVSFTLYFQIIKSSCRYWCLQHRLHWEHWCLLSESEVALM